MVSSQGLSIAAATVDLTPPAGLPMGGYLLRAGQVSSDAHDPLEASLIWLRDGQGGEVLWVVMDALSVDGELADAISRAVAQGCGCQTDAVLVCATHTHSSAAGWVKGLGRILPETADPQLRERLIEQLAGAAARLPGGLEPCRVAFAEHDAPLAGGNRNDPRGPHDDSVGAMAAIDGSGRIIAVVADYASHATVLGYENLAWSADWPGAARRALRGALAGLAPFGDAAPGESRAPTIALLQGAAGDASPRFVRRGQTFAEVDRLGGLVASAGLQAILESTPGSDVPSISVERATVELPTRQLPSAAEADANVARTERAWHEAQDGGASAPEVRIARTRYEGALVQQAQVEAGLQASVQAPIAVVRVGDAAWVHLPAELFASFGLAIRRALPQRWTRVIGYTTDYLGYVADAAAHTAGVYEANASMFDPAGGAVLTDAAISLLRAATPAGQVLASA